MDLTQLKNGVVDCFLEKPKPFTTKRDLNWKAIKKTAALGVGLAVLVLLLLPSPKPAPEGFQEQVKAGGRVSAPNPALTASQDALTQLAQAQSGVRHPPMSLDALYGGGASGGGGLAPKRDAPMILGREGGDARSQLPPGQRVAVRTLEAIRVTSQSMPVMGQVSRDCVYNGSVVLAQGTRIYGEALLDEDADRVMVKWQTAEFADGRRRPLVAMGLDSDGQAGLEAAIVSDALKNTIGQTITRFIGAYAEGSMEHGAMGASPGGVENGLKNAVAATAEDRAEAWAQGLQKERKWAEVGAGVESWAVLTQPFVFRDPGVASGG